MNQTNRATTPGRANVETPASWLTPAKAAAILKVDPCTVARYANAGRITVQRTLGGHRRYEEPEIRALAAALKAVV